VSTTSGLGVVCPHASTVKSRVCRDHAYATAAVLLYIARWRTGRVSGPAGVYVDDSSWLFPVCILLSLWAMPVIWCHYVIFQIGYKCRFHLRDGTYYSYWWYRLSGQRVRCKIAVVATSPASRESARYWSIGYLRSYPDSAGHWPTAEPIKRGARGIPSIMCDLLKIIALILTSFYILLRFFGSAAGRKT